MGTAFTGQPVLMEGIYQVKDLLAVPLDAHPASDEPTIEVGLGLDVFT